MKPIIVETHARTEMLDITARVQEEVQLAHFQNGLCLLYVPHTTSAITINECADPAVREDILMVLNQMVPDKAAYHHSEGNSPAHVKASLMGPSELVAVEQGRLVLGTWQGIFFCEFDGPRKRKLHISLTPPPHQ